MAWREYEDDLNNLDDLIINIVDDETPEESLGKLMTLGTLLFLLGTSGMVNAAELRTNLERTVKDKQVERGKVTLSKKEIAKAVEDSKKKGATEKVGKWEKAKAINVVARTLYMEARGEGNVGLNLVMTVIWNRAGGNVDNLADVCLKPLQFSCWNKLSNKTPSTYSIQFPKGAASGSGSEMSSWDVCVNLANSAFNGTFKPTNSKWNAYYNPDKADPDWADELIGAEMVGRHMVGELKDVTRTANKLKGKAKTYTVKDGDTLYAIAGKDMKKVNLIKQLNGLKSDVIRPGQVLKLA